MECLLGVHTLLGQSGNARLMATIHDDLNRFLLCYGNKMAFSVEERNIPMASLDCFYTRYLITYSNFSTSHQHLSINNLLLSNAHRGRTELVLVPPSEWTYRATTILDCKTTAFPVTYCCNCNISVTYDLNKCLMPYALRAMETHAGIKTTQLLCCNVVGWNGTATLERQNDWLNKHIDYMCRMLNLKTGQREHEMR